MPGARDYMDAKCSDTELLDVGLVLESALLEGVGEWEGEMFGPSAIK